MTICRVGKGALATCPPSLWRWARFHLRSLSYRRTWSLCPPYESVHASAFSRRDFARAIINSSPHPRNRGRRESRVPTAPAVSCAKRTVVDAHEHTGSAETARLSPRNGFTAYFELSPVSGLVCHRHWQDIFRQLSTSIAAPGPHDFAVRLGVFVRR